MGDLKQHSLIKAQERLRDQVGHALRAALIAGELRPGSVYSAPGLAAELGVSATPVREAMLDLAREGLVEPVRNKGFRITEVSERDLDQYTELRTMIEVPTIGRITKIATTEQLEALRPVAQEIVTSAREHNLIGYLEADRRFHLTLLGLMRQRPPRRDGRRPAQAVPAVRADRPGRGRKTGVFGGGAHRAARPDDQRGRRGGRGLHGPPPRPRPLPLGPGPRRAGRPHTGRPRLRRVAL